MNQTDADAPRCPRHPKTVTYLKCASCSTPICPDCFVESPVGYKCRDCGRMAHTQLSQVSLRGAAQGTLVGLLSGMLAGAFGFTGFWGIFVALIYGRFLGALIMKAAGHKIGLVMDLITGASIIIGGLAVRAGFGYHYYAAAQAAMKAAAHSPEIAAAMPPQATGWVLVMQIIDPFSLIAVIIVAAAAISRMRFDWGRW